MSNESPCIAVCVIHPQSGLCYGCGRTMPEIARWHRLPSDERHAIMAALPERMIGAGLQPPRPRTDCTS